MAETKTSQQIADLFGVTARAVQKYVSEHGMPRLERNRYDLRACVQWYIEYIRTSSKAEDENIKKERLLLVRAQRQRHELENQRRRGELVEREVVAQLYAEAATIYAAQIEGLPARCAGRVAGLSDIAEIQRTLAHECKSIRVATATKLLDRADQGHRRHDRNATARRKRGGMGGSTASPPA